jgi:hypothetical protein
VDNQTAVSPAPLRTRRDGQPDRRFGAHPGQHRRVTRKRIIQLRRARAVRKPIGTYWTPTPLPGTLRMRKYRDRKRAERKAAQEAARIAHKAALAAARAAAGLSPRKTQAQIQAAYRERRKAKGIDPYSARELAEQATKKAIEGAKKAIEEAKYENQVPAAVIDVWFAPPMDRDTALAYIRQHIVPAQPQVAEKYLDGIREQCRRHLLHVNRYTLGPDGIENARIFRALVWRQDAGKYLSTSWDFAQHLNASHLPADPATRQIIIEASQATIGTGNAIAEGMFLDAKIKEKL